MRLEYFSAKNFRSIINAQRIHVKEYTILIGKNNEGKSNLLRAMYIAMSIVGSYGIMPYGTFSASSSGLRRMIDWDKDFPLHGPRKKKITFRLDFKLNDSEILEFKEHTGCNIDGKLALNIDIDEVIGCVITVIKHGPGKKKLNTRIGEITGFISSRIVMNYIPAVRTQSSVMRIVKSMIENKLRVLEGDDEYIEAVSKIESLQEPVLKEVSGELQRTLVEFLPNIKGVDINITKDDRRRALVGQFDINIDDGVSTLLEYKGDGVKSLVALSLLKNRGHYSGASIVAIEEPESHLHPGAIHQIVEILKSLAGSDQVVISTHCPCFANRDDVKSNVIIENNSAKTARDLSSVRTALGVEASDNLISAQVVLIVEGKSDQVAITSLLKQKRKKFCTAISQGTLVVDDLGGAGNLTYKMSLYNSILCNVVALVDNDEPGRNAIDSVVRAGFEDRKNIFKTNCKGMANSELEDCYNVNVYSSALNEKYGVNLNCPEFRHSHSTWSERMKDVFNSQGRHWTDDIEVELKMLISEIVTDNPSVALEERKESFFNALVDAVEMLI